MNPQNQKRIALIHLTAWGITPCPRSWRKTAILGAAALLLMTLPATVAGGPVSLAQAPNQWSLDEQVPEYPNDTFTPFLIADRNRTVHAFTNQWVGDDERQLAIVYRQWSLHSGWSAPIDILLSPAGEARIQSAYLDSTGIIHLIFWGGDERNANIFYTSVPAANANSAAAWSRLQLVAEDAINPDSAALSGDGSGHLAIIYSGNRQGIGVYALQSTDAGQSWSEATPLYLTYDTELLPFSLRLFAGPADRIHATWNVVTNRGVDISLHYAALSLGDGHWSEPKTLAERTIEDESYFGPSFPVIAASGAEVIVMYNSGKQAAGGPVAIGRPVQTVSLSADGGENWFEPMQPFQKHLGRSGEHSLVVDSTGVVHALFTQRIENLVDGKYTIIGGIWHSEWRNGRWSEPDRFTTTVSPHDVRAVVSQGNVLLVTWREDPGAGQHGIWYSFTTLDAPEQPLAPLAAAPVVAPATPSPVVTPPSPTPTARYRPVSPEGRFGEPGLAANPAIPILLGVAPVAIIILGLLLTQLLQAKRH